MRMFSLVLLLIGMSAGRNAASEDSLSRSAAVVDSLDENGIDTTVQKNDSIVSPAIKKAAASDIPRVAPVRHSLLEEDTADTACQIAPPGFSVLPLSLPEVIDELVAHNPQLAGVRLEWLANSYAARAAWGAFEPALTAGSRYGSQQITNSRFSFDSTRYNAGVEGAILTGAKYNLGFSLSGTDPMRSIFDRPQAYTGLSINQPLLKGAWFGSPIVQIKTAALDRDIALQTYRSKLIEIIYQVESAYWTLEYAQERLRSATESVRIARKLVKDSYERLKTGKMSKLDVMEAEAGLATRLGEAEDARQGVLESISQLKMLLSSDRIGKNSFISAATLLTIRADEAAGYAKIDSATDKALAIQPDYLTRKKELEKATVSLDYRKNQRLPELNIIGSFGYSGTGGTTQAAFDKLFSAGQQTWSSEAQLRIPLFLDVESRNLLIAEKLKHKVAQENLRASEYELLASLRILSQRINAQNERLANAHTVVDFRKRLLEVEFSRLQAGKSNYRLIYDAEEKLAQARQTELESTVRCRIAFLEMEKTSGTLLRDRGLENIVKNQPILIGRLLQAAP